MAPEWAPHPRRDAARALALARDLDAPLAAAHALVNRGLTDEDAARRYLRPDLDDLHDPLLLLDLDRAVRRIQEALAAGERIFIHGDYDVDGITATFLLASVLGELGARVEHFIPDREPHGYGLSIAAVEDARRRGCGLIVTVDCGMTAVDAVRHARELGLDTIITDHHEYQPPGPEPLALVNPKRPGCRYPFRELSGAGVAFKLAEALLRGRGGLERACEYLDVVALGTIADVVPLVGENRVLARLGLERLNQKRRAGLNALMEVAGLSGRTVNSGHVAFVLAPRINAGGRMGNAEQGLRLLMARDGGEARSLAQSLEDDNQLRRRFDEEALREAMERVERELGWPDCASILLWSEKWHAGVIGIVASRLVERFHRPTVLVAIKGGSGRGSGRSVRGIDLNGMLTRCSDLLEGYGGHALAAGLTVRPERLPELRRRLERLAAEQLPQVPPAPELEFDAEVHLGECDRTLLEWLDRMAPHGLDNPEPLFVAADLAVESLTTPAQGRHLRLRVRDGTGSAEAIGFGLGGHAEELRRARRCSLAFVPTRNEWQGVERVQLKVKGVRIP